MTSSNDSISVAVRVRPAKNQNDVDEWILQGQTIFAAQVECQPNAFTFDHLFSQEKTNADVYEQVVQPIISSLMAGYNGTVFAYGQTSSGKTHTMMGSEHDPGVIKRAISQIFDEIHKVSDREFLIRISYLEIYNEQIRDLLNNTSTANLQIKGPDMAVAGLTEQVITDAEELLNYMTDGDKNRQVGCTNMNERSSRSHSIFRITIESSNRNAETNKREGVTVSQLNLVDLAGSERATQTGATGTRLREGCHINTSLTALGIVIRKLSNGEKHINFRDSKLTRILQNSLGGNSRTAIICNISPSDYETSLSTLRFGSDAKRIKNKPVVNKVISEDASLLHKRNKEIESLKELISRVEAGKEQQLKEKDDTIVQLRRKIEGLQKLAIGGELPATVSDRNASVLQARRIDHRRRETWCPGQIVASTAAASATPGTTEEADPHNDSFVAKYGTYRDHFDFCTPAKPRKRKSDEAFPMSEVKAAFSSNASSKNSESAPCDFKQELEDALREIASLKEELEFLRNEKVLYCGGACTPSAAKRVCMDPATAITTPVAGVETALSLIQEEESELEEDSPFGKKLKIMATPRQKIQGMKHENRMLKRSLIASSVCSTPAPSEDTVMTLCNRSVPSSCSDTKPETRDTSCQCEQPEDEKRADIVILSEKKTLIDAATSPAASATGLTGALDGMSSPAIDTPLRTNPRAQNLTSLIDFCSPREVRRTVLAPARCSEASWLDTERTPTILPSNVQDAEVQVAMLSEVHQVATQDAATCTDSAVDVDDNDESVTEADSAAAAESSAGYMSQSTVVASEVVRGVDAHVQTDAIVQRVEPERTDSECQVYLATRCQGTQATVETADSATSPVTLVSSRGIATQTADEKVCTTDGVRGLDAILADPVPPPPPPLPMPSSKAAKTRDVGVMARLEELWVIKMKLEQEQAAREEAEGKLDEVWKERGKLLNTNDKYLEYFKALGIDPRSILNGQGPPMDKVNLKTRSVKDEEVDTLKRKYETLKEFCFRHPDIKERVLKDRIIVRHKQPNKTPTKEEQVTAADDKEEEVENVEPLTDGGTSPAKAVERPLAELQDMQQFKGAKYLAEADPGECRPS